jgi:hypothetical protein
VVTLPKKTFMPLSLALLLHSAHAFGGCKKKTESTLAF